MKRQRRDRKQILLHARREGYHLHRINEWNYVLKKEGPKFGKVTVNVYWKKGSFFFTFMSALDHPKKGKTQLTRKFLTISEVNELLTNPRKHTNQGYYKKRQR